MDDLSFLPGGSFDRQRIVRQGFGAVDYGGDDHLIVMFFNKPKQNPQKSLAAGCPQFDDQVFVRIHPPGERLNIVERPARGEDSRRWPRQWEQFHKNQEQVPEGYPIDLLYPDKPAVAATLRANGVYTVEQCAGLSAHAIENIGMGCQTWVNESKRHLELANKGVGIAKLRSELEDRDRQIKVLQQQVHDLSNAVKSMQSARVQQADAMSQVLMAGAMTRPTHMPNVAFDEQTAMINVAGADARPAPAKRRRIALKK